jgi:hypothetical protein
MVIWRAWVGEMWWCRKRERDRPLMPPPTIMIFIMDGFLEYQLGGFRFNWADRDRLEGF